MTRWTFETSNGQFRRNIQRSRHSYSLSGPSETFMLKWISQVGKNENASAQW